MQSAVEAAKKQVEQDKKNIDDTIQNSLLASAEKSLRVCRTISTVPRRYIRACILIVTVKHHTCEP
ncbi:MAG: hypothetical protein ACLSCO_19075 [Gallintestinimicrobium sp.]